MCLYNGTKFLIVNKSSLSVRKMMISRIGIFRALYLGDMLCIIPAVRSVRSAFPHAQIFLIGLPWQRDFVKRFSHYFDEFIEFPGWPGLPEQQPDVENILRFLQHIRTYHFDIIFQMQGNGEITNSMCMLWGAKKVCGLRKGQGYAPDHDLFPVSEDNEHEVQRFLKLPAALNLSLPGEELEFPLFPEERQRAMQILHESGLHTGEYVCVHPGARDPRRRWAAEKFAVIADKIVTSGYPIVLTGSAEERDVIKAVQEKIRGPVVNIVELYGHLGVGELAALVSMAKLLVSNDTGVSHLAAAMEVPSVIIFSQYSEINRWRPLNDTLHIAIPWERTSDIGFVERCVVNMLGGDKTAGVYQHRHI
jgi:ADP-heptose:LPS heptosyltransferase